MLGMVVTPSAWTPPTKSSGLSTTCSRDMANLCGENPPTKSRDVFTEFLSSYKLIC